MEHWSTSREVARIMGDQDTWVLGLPQLWQACAFPEGRWRPARRPLAGTGPDNADYRARFAYWHPLLHLALGPLGWADPALGSRRWVEQGGQTPDSFTTVMRRWWGRDVLVLQAYFAYRAAEAMQHWLRPRKVVPLSENTDIAAGQWRPHWDSVLSGGWDPLHLSMHAPSMLTGLSETPGAGQRLGLLQGQEGAALMLPVYAGWLGHLHRSGDGSQPIDVVARPIGWLGTYRMSPVTRRWYACDHDIHLLGWPESAAAEEPRR